VLHSKRIESTSPEFAYCVTTWDDETGEAEKVVYDERGRTLRRAVVTRFPPERWDGEVVGEATWFDAEGRVFRRAPVLLGRSLALD
jgi:hypothetical protein